MPSQLVKVVGVLESKISDVKSGSVSIVDRGERVSLVYLGKCGYPLSGKAFLYARTPIYLGEGFPRLYRV